MKKSDSMIFHRNATTFLFEILQAENILKKTAPMLTSFNLHIGYIW